MLVQLALHLHTPAVHAFLPIHCEYTSANLPHLPDPTYLSILASHLTFYRSAYLLSVFPSFRLPIYLSRDLPDCLCCRSTVGLSICLALPMLIPSTHPRTYPCPYPLCVQTFDLSAYMPRVEIDACIHNHTLSSEAVYVYLLMNTWSH